MDDRITKLVNQWSREKRIAKQGVMAAIRYEYELEQRRTERECVILMLCFIVLVIVACCVV